ncbi:hypothetical protein UK23_14720 [Lentzea aerocolonigenes]|uniref:Uncharacterized protein n=1 Tax=Lentzea aerocolonigenes TaxID=68170 RepID=A0A0F0H0Y2_LENAE|nr:hypothetical protein [Lentzea aerocolonigenes]KJK49230.1 hypothetical protein UK23_14720 [Lentzea aerocolonigenes]
MKIWAVVVLVLAVLPWGGAALLDHSASPRTENIEAPRWLTLEAQDKKLRVEVSPGWVLVNPGESSTATVQRGDATVLFEARKATTDEPRRHFGRIARSFDRSGVEVADGAEFRTRKEFAALRGVAVAEGRLGELVVLSKNKAVMSVLWLHTPSSDEHAADVVRMIESIEEAS